jgi:hypothetical protein
LKPAAVHFPLTVAVSTEEKGDLDRADFVYMDLTVDGDLTALRDALRAISANKRLLVKGLCPPGLVDKVYKGEAPSRKRREQDAFLNEFLAPEVRDILTAPAQSMMRRVDELTAHLYRTEDALARFQLRPGNGI